MDDKLIFTEEESKTAQALWSELNDKLEGMLQSDDGKRLRATLEKAAENGKLERDAFGLNPIVNALQTAKIAIEDIGLRRDGVMAIMLHDLVQGGYLTLEDVEKEYGTGVKTIIHGLVKIQ